MYLHNGSPDSSSKMVGEVQLLVEVVGLPVAKPVGGACNHS